MGRIEYPDLWYVYNMKQLDEKHVRFDVRLRTSAGFVYMMGFRLDEQGKLLAPGYKAGGYHRPLIKLPENARAAIKHKAFHKIKEGALNGRDVEISADPSSLTHSHGSDNKEDV